MQGVHVDRTDGSRCLEHRAPVDLRRPGQPTLDKFYAQIAWFSQGTAQLIDMKLLSAGGFDFVEHLYRDVAMSKAQLQYRVSDHYPLCAEFEA